MSKRTNDFLGCAFVAILIILGFIFFAKSCSNGTIKAPSFHNNNSYDSKKNQERISKQLDQDIKNHAEYEIQVTCPHCNGMKNIPDLDDNCSKYGIKPCPVCNGKGWIVEKRRWGKTNDE